MRAGFAALLLAASASARAQVVQVAPELPSAGLSVPVGEAQAALSAPELSPSLGAAPLAPLDTLNGAPANGAVDGAAEESSLDRAAEPYAAAPGRSGLQPLSPAESGGRSRSVSPQLQAPEARLGWMFDRSASGGQAPFVVEPAFFAAQEGAAASNALPAGSDGEPLEIKFLAAQANSLLHSKRTGTYRLIKEDASGRLRKGSKWWWTRFKNGVPFNVVAGGYPVMTTKVTGAATKKIRDVTKKDLKGIFTDRELALFGIRKLRGAMISNLQGMGGQDVGLDSTVRLIYFQSWGEVNKGRQPPAAVSTIPREPLKLPARSPLRQMGEILPKVILLDLDVYQGPVPAPILEDLSKLQRTGVTVVALSRRTQEEASDDLLRNMSGYQRDVLLPYRFLAAFENGGKIVAFEKGGRTRVLSRAAFQPHETEALKLAVSKAIAAAGASPRSVKVKETAGGSLDVELPGTADAPAFARALSASIEPLRLDARLAPRVEGGRAFVRILKTDLAASMPKVLETLQDEQGVFVLGSEVAALTDDASIPDALGAPVLAKKAGVPLAGPELVENALGAMLGEHRENRAGDLAGSASRMQSFLKHHAEYLDQYVLEHEEALRNIHFFSGHMVHKALDWAVHELRQGRRPSGDELSAKLAKYWEDEHARVGKPIGLAPGYTLPEFLSASQARAKVIYQHVLDIADEGTIMLGTEIPNFFMLRSYDKTGELRRRYVIHTIFDLVALKPTSKGKAELVILDFKSGPPQTMQKLAQDLQALTYSLFLRYKWQHMTEPYSIVGGKKYEIERARTEFLYSPVRLSPAINTWDLEKTESKIIRTLDRIQKEQEQNVPKPRKAKGR